MKTAEVAEVEDKLRDVCMFINEQMHVKHRYQFFLRSGTDENASGKKVKMFYVACRRLDLRQNFSYYDFWSGLFSSPVEAFDDFFKTCQLRFADDSNFFSSSRSSSRFPQSYSELALRLAVLGGGR